MTTRIYISRRALELNRQDGAGRGTIVVVSGDSGFVCHDAEIDGPSRILYDASGTPEVWIETAGTVTGRQAVDSLTRAAAESYVLNAGGC